ncbi:hypothetical protein NIES4071_15240 [Calothrix sp. NIES-4071]|nr:hypothetical protein NIES4071_15240 [Calothrix sp. NIES-4071]BAZ55861.1 hypothetical protein NIES4105_15190 [Calothrix sp. NIES-4105]
MWALPTISRFWWAMPTLQILRFVQKSNRIPIFATISFESAFFFSKCYPRNELKHSHKSMDTLVEKLSVKLSQWQPDVAKQVRQYVEAIIELADNDSLDILQSRVVNQEALNKSDTVENR